MSVYFIFNYAKSIRMLPSLLMDQNNLNDAGKFVEQIYYSGQGTNTLFYPILCKRKHYDRAQFIFYVSFSFLRDFVSYI